MTATFYVGDAIQVMNRLPEKSVDLILTSPPFLALRSYLPADHPDKALEGGSQATPGAYIDWLIDVVEACARVLAPHGSMCIELGDTYAGGTGFQGTDDFAISKGRQYWVTDSGTGPMREKIGNSWPLPKSLSLIPELFRLTLVYGTNPLTGRQTERWRLRNVIRWVRPNPPVGALGDKFRPATSELMVFCKSAKRFFDLDAVREPWNQSTRDRFGEDGERESYRIGLVDQRDRSRKEVGLSSGEPWRGMNPSGAPPLDWWTILPGGYQGAHYAVWPPELCIKPIKAMSPERVCRQCGEPSRRIVDTERVTDENWDRPHQEVRRGYQGASFASNGDTLRTTLGWTDCGHNTPVAYELNGRVGWRNGMVLDPFAGSGTTLAVATGHGRDAIGIDLDERNYELALQRVGPLVLTRGEVAA